MWLSARARLALRLMLEVHRRGGATQPVKLRDVAFAAGASVKFLEQLAVVLKSHGLLRGVCGRNGGYLLGRTAETITVGDVLRSVQGPLELAIGPDPEPTCLTADFCPCRVMWRMLRERIQELLEAHTLADLGDAEWLRERVQELVAAEAEREARDVAPHRVRLAPTT